MKIDIEFSAERRLGNPKIKIQVDDYDTLHNGDCPDTFNTDFNLNAGEHHLIITHYNKTANDHMYDDNNNVIADKHVHINSISFDDVKLNLTELNAGVFWPVRDFNDDAPISITPNLYLGFNGQWKLKFFYPAIDWIIAERQDGIDLNDTIFKSSDSLLNDAKDFFNGDLPEV